MNVPDNAARDLRVASRLLGRPLQTVGRLAGGEHARTTAYTDGTTEYVLRTFPVDDDAVANEVRVLPRLGELGGLAPSLIAAEDSADGSTILTQRLPGGPPAPDLPAATIAQRLAPVLARIHAVDGSGLRLAPEPPAQGDTPIARRAQRDWSSLEREVRVLTHWDFWCGNLLWTDDQVTGVVDWSGARHGPRGIDLAWSRLDLVLLGDPEAAETLLAHYCRFAGQPLDNIAAWDVQAAAQADPVVEDWSANYVAIGRSELTGPVLRQRLNAWIQGLITSD